MRDETVSYDPDEETKLHIYSDDSSSFSYRAKSSQRKRKTLNVRQGSRIMKNLTSKRTNANNSSFLTIK